MSRTDEIARRLSEDQSAQPTREEADYLLSHSGADRDSIRSRNIVIDSMLKSILRLDNEQFSIGNQKRELILRLRDEIRATAPTETGARCRECGHGGWVVKGVCQWKPGLETSFEEICGHRCTGGER